jgi:hypothetical protein
MITQRERWVPGSPRMQCFKLSTEERETGLWGIQKFRSFPQ